MRNGDAPTPSNAEGRTNRSLISIGPALRAGAAPPYSDTAADKGASRAAPLAPSVGRDPVQVTATAATAIVEPQFARPSERTQEHTTVEPYAYSTDATVLPPAPLKAAGEASIAKGHEARSAGTLPLAEASAREAPSSGISTSHPDVVLPDVGREYSSEVRVGSRLRRAPAWILVTAWMVTAAVPAVAVWAIMRTSSMPGQMRTLEYRARPDRRVTEEHAGKLVLTPGTATMAVTKTEGSAQPGPTALASDSAVTTVASAGPDATAPAHAASAMPSGIGSKPNVADSKPTAAPSSAVVVATDSPDRVGILVKTRPEGARVLKRGKEIGRTPLTIEIGRGEHRIFEVAIHGIGSKRVLLNGEKSEVFVDMAVEAKPQTVFVPASMPTNNHERLR